MSGHTVTILPDNLIVHVEENETIVEALRKQGLRTRYKCRRGGCGACRATLRDGLVDYPTQVSKIVIDGPAPEINSCLPCRATPVTDIVIELGPRDRVVDVLGGLRKP